MYRRLAAIMAADLAGYSRMMAADETRTHLRVQRALDTIFLPEIEGYSGTVIKTMGDGLLAVFPSVLAASACAVKLQRRLTAAARKDTHPDLLEFRIGINVGDVILQDGDVFGEGVNLAARVEALAPPGGICVTRQVRDQIRDRLDHPLQDFGQIKVKNLARPVRLFAIRWDEDYADAAGEPWLKRYRRAMVAVMLATVIVLAEGLPALQGPLDSTVRTDNRSDFGSQNARLLYAHGRINLRAGPGTDFSVIGKAQPGQAFVVVSEPAQTEPARWLEVRAASGTAFVFAELLHPAPPKSDLPTLPRLAVTPDPATPAQTPPAAAGQLALPVVDLTPQRRTNATLVRPEPIALPRAKAPQTSANAIAAAAPALGQTRTQTDPEPSRKADSITVLLSMDTTDSVYGDCAQTLGKPTVQTLPLIAGEWVKVPYKARVPLNLKARATHGDRGVTISVLPFAGAWSEADAIDIHFADPANGAAARGYSTKRPVGALHVCRGLTAYVQIVE